MNRVGFGGHIDDSIIWICIMDVMGLFEVDKLKRTCFETHYEPFLSMLVTQLA